MTLELNILLMAALSIGFFHTLFGPDHYLPFIVLSKSRKWSLRKTTIITFLCGVGHILGSVILGFFGIAIGIAIKRIEFFESIRGSIAAWFLISFGFVYCIWGIKNAIKAKEHSHIHLHSDGTKHSHSHVHFSEHSHIHKNKGSLTPWVLFIIFILGPCEPLIPILMYPAAQNNLISLILVVLVFAFATLSTMIGMVLISYYGLQLTSLKRLERYSHALAGLIIFASGIAIEFLGL